MSKSFCVLLPPPLLASVHLEPFPILSWETQFIPLNFSLSILFRSMFSINFSVLLSNIWVFFCSGQWISLYLLPYANEQDLDIGLGYQLWVFPFAIDVVRLYLQSSCDSLYSVREWVSHFLYIFTKHWIFKISHFCY